MWGSFFWENVHFVANFFAALVFFAMFWLYFDAWLERKALDEVPKLLGILFLCLSFIVHATQLESDVLRTQLWGTNWQETTFIVTRVLGYLLLIIGVVLDPLMSAPKTKGLSELSAMTIPIFPLIVTSIPVLIPLMCASVAWLYLRRETIGLERHLKTVTISFFILTFYELLGLAHLFVHSDNVALYKLVAPFSWLWITEHLVMLLGVGLLGSWVWQYLTKRLQPQLFMIFTTTILGIFLLKYQLFLRALFDQCCPDLKQMSKF